jgi:signal peptidase I
LLGLVAIFAMARCALSTKPFAAGDEQSSAVAVVRGYLDVLIAAGLVALFLITFVVRIYYIPSESMLPTLVPGDVVVVDQLDYRLGNPHTGDVAVFTPPQDAGATEFIKRVVGVPGDTIRIHNGIVYRNGQPLREPYATQPPDYDLAIEDYGIDVDGAPLDKATAQIPPKPMWQAPDRIPKGFYFMLGDNRNTSDDSHVWGFARRTSFTGRAFLIFWPLERLTILHA